MRKLILVPFVVFAGACDTATVSEPDTDLLEPAFAANPAANPAVKRVVGVVQQYVSPPQRRSFSFNATERADGTVEGEWLLSNSYADAYLDGHVTCVTIFGNQAWLGGIVEAGDEGEFPPGTAVGFWAEDSGQGANTTPDRLSFLYSGTLHNFTDLDWCNDVPNGGGPPTLELADIESGSIRIECVGEDCAAVCSDGTCADLGMTDCGGECSYLNDEQNCGSCVSACAAWETCAADAGGPGVWACDLQCPTEWPYTMWNADGLSENGCESRRPYYPECTDGSGSTQCDGYACLPDGSSSYGGTCADALLGGCENDGDCAAPYQCYDMDILTGLGVCEWRP